MNVLNYFGGYFKGNPKTLGINEPIPDLSTSKSGFNTRGNATPGGIDSPKSVLKTQDNTSSTDNMSTTTISKKPFDGIDYKISSTFLEPIDFKYSVYDLIKLFKDYPKMKLDPNEMSSFFNELIKWYSETLVQVSLILTEIKELHDIKTALNARYKAYIKHSKKLEDENKSLVEKIDKFADLRNENENLKKQRTALEKSVQELKTEKNHMQGNLGENQKQVTIYKQKWLDGEAEFSRYKQIIKSEFRNLRFELSEVEKERDELRDLLINFKKFCETNNIIENIS